MKNVFKSGLVLLATLAILLPSQAQKKTKNLFVEREIDLPAQTLWKVVGEDYGAIANSHPRIVKSDYINGSLEAGEGAERICYFNDKGSQFLKEKMTEWNPAEMTFVNQVFQAGKFPLDAESTRAVYKVTDLGNGKSKITFDMNYRTKPAFMGGMVKGKFKGLIDDYLLAVEHHAKTGEQVTRDNFKEIKKGYEM